MELIDSHCHIDFSEFDANRSQTLQRCQQLGINQIIVPGVNQQHSENLIALCQQHPMLLPTLGLHPIFLEQHQDNDIVLLEQQIQQHPVIAIGEIGLDFYVPELNIQKQTALFTAQLQLAKKYDLPVILHVRKAHDEVLKLLRQIPVRGGIVHAFNGSLQQAEHYMKLGFLFGVGGALTYPRATKLQYLFQQLPLTHIALETDAPDMPLYEQQGKPNSPENIPTILAKLAELRDQAPTMIAQTTTQNVKSLFQLC